MDRDGRCYLCQKIPDYLTEFDTPYIAGGYFLCLECFTSGGIIKEMKKIATINKQYPWLKIVVFLIIFVLSLGAGIGVSAYNDDSDAAISLQTENNLGTYTDVAPVLIEGEIKNVEGVEELKNKQEEVASEQSEEERMADLSGKMLVALTFDDGPLSEVTGRILDTLKEKSVKATFFMMGMQVDKYPEMTKRVAAEGHEIGNHTWGHKDLTSISPDEVREEITRTNEIIKNVTGVEVKYVRPPYGFFDQDVMDVVNERLVTWSVDPRDWENMDAEITYSAAVNGAYDGAVILMHDIYQSTADALPRIIDDLRAAGYEFVTIDEMSKLRDWVPGEGY